MTQDEEEKGMLPRNDYNNGYSQSYLEIHAATRPRHALDFHAMNAATI